MPQNPMTGLFHCEFSDDSDMRRLAFQSKSLHAESNFAASLIYVPKISFHFILLVLWVKSCSGCLRLSRPFFSCILGK